MFTNQKSWFVSGYGHLAPATTGGQIFTILFASVGIPIFFLTIALIVTSVIVPTEAALQRITKKKKVPVVLLEIILSFVFAVITIGVFILLPSLAFTLVEDWSYFESIYFSVITLSTVGFGDFVAG